MSGLIESKGKCGQEYDSKCHDEYNNERDDRDYRRYNDKYDDRDYGRYNDKYDDKGCSRYNDKHDGRDYNRYHDIINLPPPKSRKHPPMSLSNRAAQFAPFSALTGHKEIIKETARRTGEKIELEEDAIQGLNEKVKVIQENISNRPEVIITYFRPDDKKEGGAYITEKRTVKRVDQTHGQLLMTDGVCISVEDIFQMELLSN